jgi:RNA polymerase sigma-70 factor, ECF subfamily
MTLKDTEIINGIIEGKTENERLLFEKYDQKIYYIVYSKLGIYKNFAVDLIQDIKISLLLSIRNGNFRCENELSLGAYLYGISMNKIRDCINKSNRESVYLENQSVHLEKSYNDQYELENTELKNLIRKALKCLKIKYQEVLYLKFFEELSVKEISDKIKLPARRVSERLNYALKLIKKEIIKTGYFA